MKKQIILLSLLLPAVLASSRRAGDIEREEILRLCTPRGAEYSTILPDGTRVWLNVESELTFPARPGGKTRDVYLRGEAYFKVARGEEAPLVIHSGGMEIVATTAEFNARGYPGEEATVTPVNGSLLVRESPRDDASRLHAGQQAVARGRVIEVKGVDDPLPRVAWKEGYFIYHDAPLERVLEELSRWYDFSYSFQDPASRRHVVTATLQRFDNLDRLLATLSRAGNYSFSREQKQVTVGAR
jgi:ferric-dicitrate binding protein FerR (iron transport regulator)